MSLITLSSGDSQKPYLFNSYFPQPITIPVGSQVCMLKFLHFRNEDEFIVNSMNNRLFFCIGNTQVDGKREVILTTGSYTGAELATQLQTQMNAALQQQNYTWTVTYSTIDDKFGIAYTSVPTPGVSGGEWSDYVDDDTLLEIRNNDSLGSKTTIIPKLRGNLGEPDYVSGFLRKGILIHSGLVSVESIGFRLNNDEMTDTTQFYTPSFNDCTIGLVRDVISVPAPGNLNVNSQFKPQRQDVRIDMLEDGVITVYTIYNTSQVNPSKPNFANIRQMRQIPLAALQNITSLDIVDKTKIVNTFFRVIMSLHRTGGTNDTIQIVAQLQWSQDRGATYTSAVSTEQDPGGNNYIRNHTPPGGAVMEGVFWVSSEAGFNDDGEQKIQMLQTKRCPYIPSLTSYDSQEEIGTPELLSGDSDNWLDGTNIYKISGYIGTEDWDYVFLRPSLTPYYIRNPVISTSGDNTVFRVGATETSAPTFDLTYNANDGEMVLDPTGLGISLTYSGTTLPEFTSAFPQYLMEGVFNGEDRPVLNITPTLGEDNDVGSGTLVGADLSQKAMLWLRRLDAEDIVANSGKPAHLKSGDTSGNLGLILGSAKNFVINSTPSEGQPVFTSTSTPDRVAKSTTLHISIPELPVKSYEGGYSGVGKNLAVLPREEFKAQGSNSGRLVYVSDFENWLDLDTATDLHINQFSVEVRNPDGSLSTDLSPDTTLQIKFRQDPTRLQRELVSMVRNSQQRTGQILSQELNNLGS
jgi:hypothetical protein